MSSSGSPSNSANRPSSAFSSPPMDVVTVSPFLSIVIDCGSLIMCWFCPANAPGEGRGGSGGSERTRKNTPMQIAKNRARNPNPTYFACEWFSTLRALRVRACLRDSFGSPPPDVVPDLEWRATIQLK
eukprot:CAMPEP_0206123468 /NCGR_PEP_ID=MMETSP1472-20131121/3637_1 /ASSEMBLY_ACC=CAM_ASM_001108 /TAXON_ID=41880 /ORGANISM="Pycnococcus provasolii, Strain RCC251" /LENGTH=127 /DNA_ID=CAMNT_0053514079 /DNA_START=69 /DNA_END=452 /DNA_ORIENTATION=+